jgi:ATP-dependent protease ClpP protease subunit
MSFNENQSIANQNDGPSDTNTAPTTKSMFRQFLQKALTISDLVVAKLLDEQAARQSIADAQKKLDQQDYFFYSFWGGVDRPDVLDCIQQIRNWVKANPNKKRIILFLNCPGGYVLDANALISYSDYLKGKGYEITVQALGEAASAAAALMDCASPGRRFLAPRTRLLIHEAAWSYEGPFYKQDSEEKFNERLFMDYLEIVADRSIYKGRVQDLANIIRGIDYWRTAEEAIAEGFADEITMIDEV